MRYINKYKYLNTLPTSLVYFPKRILQFKRPKWLKVKGIFSNKNFNRRNYPNNEVIKLRFKSWERLQKHFKEGLHLKNQMNMLFGFSISIRYYKKLLKKNYKQFQDIFLHNIIGLFYRLDIFLWKLSFFNSVFEANQAIKSNYILVNGRVAKNIFLKKGDTIQITSKLNLSKISVLEHLPLFLEIDYYSMSIVVIKNPQDLNFEEYLYFVKDFIKIRTFLDYIKAK